MEVVLLSSLALLGYELSKGGKVPRTRQDTTTASQKVVPSRANAFPFAGSHTSPKPFFRSAKTQNTNDVIKQQKMETFTGVEDVGWNHKKEVENMFSPTKGLSHIHGTPNNNNTESRTDRYAMSITGKMDGVAPVEKQRVGPGLNTGAGTEGSGGFHDTFRILPDNVNAYKKNNLPGRIVPGKGITGQRDIAPNVEDNKRPERYYSLKERQVAPGKSQYSAQSMKPTYVLQATCRGDGCDDMIAGPVGEIPGPTNRSDSTRHGDTTKCHIEGNPHMHVSGTGAYAGDTQYVVPQGEREQCTETTNAHMAASGQSTYFAQGARATLREEQQKHGGHVHNSSYVTGGYDTKSYNAVSTYRDNENDYTVAPKYMISGGSSRQYNVNQSQREEVNSEHNGPAASIHKAGASQYGMRHADPYSKREDVQTSYAPNGGRMNVRGDANNIVGASEFVSDTNRHPVTHGKGRSAVPSAKQFGNVACAPKIQTTNQRNDFSIASSQLASNPYSMSVTS